MSPIKGPRVIPLSIHEELLTVQEVAAEYRVHEETVRRWVRSGYIKGVLTSGFRVKLRRSDVVQMVDSSIAEDPDVTQDEIIQTLKASDEEDSTSGYSSTDAAIPVGDDSAARTRQRGRRKNRW